VRETKQRGSGWSIRLALWAYRCFGYWPFFILLYPIAFVYYVKASNVRHALKLYYKQIGVKYTQWRYFTHLRKFAIVMTDRFVSKCDIDAYTIIADKEKIQEYIKEGAIMLLSHFGGWSVALEPLKNTNLHINIIMQEVIKEEIKAIEIDLSKKATQSNVCILDLANTTPLSASIKIAQALANKEIVAMMGDRANNPKHAIKAKFFDALAEFNKTPFELAKKTNLPIIMVFITYIKPRTYEINYINLKPGLSVEKMLEAYIQEYESVIRKAPDQWFNLYDFWGEDK
jgi:predicted LPLAT superfamily acyltransferase